MTDSDHYHSLSDHHYHSLLERWCFLMFRSCLTYSRNITEIRRIAGRGWILDSHLVIFKHSSPYICHLNIGDLAIMFENLYKIAKPRYPEVIISPNF
ncbi:hypothetical protein CEXT_1531 [Caerostris extrusa]|uniref:Uncharacterized protein n=1 Tax=Caerostris extrusa TaxID=172846 RepID=A0AAV4PGK6_CAEEX|nr:hypothetical protein CEXT_1531 [Caerostris extrusa]